MWLEIVLSVVYVYVHLHDMRQTIFYCVFVHEQMIESCEGW